MAAIKCTGLTGGLGLGKHCHSKELVFTKPIFLMTAQEMAGVMQGVDVMLMMSSSHPFALDYMTLEFYECLIGDNLLDQCKAVVLRIASAKGDDPFLKGSKPLTANDILTKSGLSKASNLQKKLCEHP